MGKQKPGQWVQSGVNAIKTTMTEPAHREGGCQCGGVRYRLTAAASAPPPARR